MTIALAYGKIAPEFTGQARAFRDRVAPDPAIGTGMRRIGADAIATMGRRQKPYRPEQLAGYERAWRQLSGPGQLSLTIERTNKTLRIVDTRINLAVVTSSSWADHGTEHSLFLIESVVDLSPNKAETVSTTVATLSLYALARFYRYSPDTTDAALLDDLRTISKLVPPMLSAPAMTRVQIPTDNGTWLGHVSPFSDTAALKTQTAAIRTFN